MQLGSLILSCNPYNDLLLSVDKGNMMLLFLVLFLNKVFLFAYNNLGVDELLRILFIQARLMIMILFDYCILSNIYHSNKIVICQSLLMKILHYTFAECMFMQLFIFIFL